MLGGICYEYFNLPKQSPTVGCYFFAADYIKFLTNLHYYFSINLRFISYKESKHKDTLEQNSQTTCPIAVLDDIEIVFLHYKTEDEVREKWVRRVSRINWDNIIVKFSYMNNCNDDLVRQFTKMNFHKKILFVAKKITNDNQEIVIPGNKTTGEVYNDTFYWNKYIDIIKFLNE